MDAALPVRCTRDHHRARKARARTGELITDLDQKTCTKKPQKWPAPCTVALHMKPKRREPPLAHCAQSYSHSEHRGPGQSPDLMFS